MSSTRKRAKSPDRLLPTTSPGAASLTGREVKDRPGTQRQSPRGPSRGEKEPSQSSPACLSSTSSHLGQGEDGEARAVREFRFEAENQTALDGTTVWAKLIEEGKAVGVGAFRSRALLVDLRDDDYGRPLDELRDLFWSSPRLPLLPGGNRT